MFVEYYSLAVLHHYEKNPKVLEEKKSDTMVVGE
jgi:hypothetical protein